MCYERVQDLASLLEESGVLSNMDRYSVWMEKARQKREAFGGWNDCRKAYGACIIYLLPMCKVNR